MCCSWCCSNAVNWCALPSNSSSLSTCHAVSPQSNADDVSANVVVCLCCLGEIYFRETHFVTICAYLSCFSGCIGVASKCICNEPKCSVATKPSSEREETRSV